jgi:hypothetical protein
MQNFARMVWIVLVLAGICLLPQAAQAQSTFGSVLGTVIDQQGRSIPGAEVTLTHQETNIVRNGSTSEQGNYEFLNLVPGTYQVRASRTGFKSFVKGDIEVGSRQAVRVDAVLEVGATTETVTVVATTPGLLETETSSLSGSIAGGEVHFLSPTTDSQRPWTLLRLNPLVQNTASGTRFSIGGAYPSQSEFQVDGITSPIGSGSPAGSTLMTAEGVQEVRVLGGNNSAEYASPAVYQQISKSGGNALHGDVYYYYNAPGLNARVATSTTGKPSLIFHQFGGNVNGPIRLPKLYNGRDRTFFSLSWQSKRQGGTQLYAADVPTLVNRNGVFSRAVLDPDNNRTPFANNTIPASRINAVSRNIQTTYYPEPNTPDPNAITRNHQTIGPSGTTREEASDLRLDHRVGDRHWFFGSVGGSQFNNRAYDSNLPTMGFRVSTRKLYRGAVSYTYNLSASLLNEFRAGFMRDNSPAGGARNGREVLRELGIQFPSSLPAPNVRGFPVINITGLTALAQQNTTTNISASYQLTDTVSWIHDRHTFKGGLNVYLEQPNYWQIPQGAFGNFFFQTNYTGVAYADFLLGIPAYVTTTGINPNQYMRSTNYGLFFQDDYKVRRDLTLNLGLRWDYQGPIYNKNNALYNFDPATGGMIKAAQNTPVNSAFAANYPNVRILEAAQAGLPERTLRFADRNNLAPRIGFAWRPRGSTSFVVRGGWGKFTDIIGQGVVATQAGGGLLNRGNSRYDNVAAPAAFRFPYPFPAVVTGEAAPPSLTANGINPRMANPYVQQWNLTLEKSLWETAFRASYLGTKTTNLIYNRDINQRVTPGDTSNRSRPYSAYGYGGTIAYLDNGGNQIYHGLILDTRRRFRNGFLFQAGYAFAKNISDIVESETDANGTSSNALNRSLDRGQVGYQRRHSFSAMGLWILPFGRGQKLLSGLPGWASHAVSGWELSPELFSGSGQYFTPCRSTTNPLTGATCGQVARPDRIGDGNNGPKQTGGASVKWFDPSAFSNPAATVLGNSGRNVLLGPGFWHLSLSLTKRFRFLENKEVWFSLSSENLLNHPNWNNPSSSAELTVGQAAFGSTASLMGSDRAAQRFPSRNIWARIRIMF